MAKSRGRGGSRRYRRDARGRFARTGTTVKRGARRAGRSVGRASRRTGQWMTDHPEATKAIVWGAIGAGYTGYAVHVSRAGGYTGVYGKQARRYNKGLRKNRRKQAREAWKQGGKDFGTHFKSSYQNAREVRRSSKAFSKTHGLPAYHRPKVKYDYVLKSNGKLRKRRFYG